MKPINRSEATPGRTDTGSSPPAPAAAAPGGARPQRVGTNAPAALPVSPRPAAAAGAGADGPGQPVQRAAFAAVAQPLTDSSEHSVATIARSNARPRLRSFDENVLIRHFDSGLSPARSNAGEEQTVLRSVAPLAGPRAGGRRRPPAAPAAANPAPLTAATATPANSRWAASGPAQHGGAGALAPPRRREDDGPRAPAARPSVARSHSDVAPRAPVRRPAPDDDNSV